MITVSETRNFLLDCIVKDFKEYWGRSDEDRINKTTNLRMDDKTTSASRYKVICDHFDLQKSAKILDMASGCGTFVFYGRLKGYNVFGVEPEDWKNKFNLMKIEAYGYPKEWKNSFINSYGEYLPFHNECFDVVSSYQTIEHVIDVRACLQEMIRVTRKGGCIHLHFPDYKSSFEGHYRLPWLPLLPKFMAKVYLRLLDRPTKGLDTLNYVTKQNVVKILHELNIPLDIVDLDKVQFKKRVQKLSEQYKLHHLNSAVKTASYFLILMYTYLCMPLKRLFRREKSVSLLLYKK